MDTLELPPEDPAEIISHLQSVVSVLVDQVAELVKYAHLDSQIREHNFDLMWTAIEAIQAEL
jgi:hypothetical protein